MAERRIKGECSKCGILVTLIENSERPTCRADGSRYVYTLLPDEGWCIFRCEGCEEVIEDTFDPAEWQHNAGRPNVSLVK